MRFLLLTLVSLVFLAAPACEESSTPGQAGDPCTYDTDCAGILRCFDGECGTGENGDDGHDASGDGGVDAGADAADPGGRDGDACVPDCAGRVCGLDPLCGLSCGLCPGDERCTLEGACFLPGGGNHGDLCGGDPDCQGDMVCLKLGTSVGFCSAQCPCGETTGCPVTIPESQCLWQNPVDQTCWCGYLCPNDVSECPGGGAGWTCDRQGDSGVCIPGVG